MPAMAYDAQTAQSWMEQFAQALAAYAPVNDPAMTADPARAGQQLLEYAFGTVLVRGGSAADAGNILEIDIRSDQITDCRGVRVGMPLRAALDGTLPAYSTSALYVLGTQESGYGWSWAYLSESSVYGVEYISYGGQDAAMREYTLTYVIEDDRIAAIRMKASDAVLSQAQDGLETAEEIAARQDSEVLIKRNSMPMLVSDQLQVMGEQALGVPVAKLVASLGEPQSVQTLPQGSGRVLVYDGAVVTLGFNEATGEELVRSISVSNSSFEGPNRLRVGMSLTEAAALFRADADVYSCGGTLYLEGEAIGEPPYGELRVLQQGEMTLSYACAVHGGETAMLQAGISDGVVSYWYLMYMNDMQGGV